MRVLGLLTSIFLFVNGNDICLNGISNQCIQFSVTSGTGCAWMCNYCANQLGTNNYYFTDNVCIYKDGEGCVGNPIVGKTYTCCSANFVTE
jgi:hypothetical protein